jgi:hypothetical protein
MDDRLLTSTMLLHLISTENLFSRSRIVEMEKNLDGTLRQRLSYDVGVYLLLPCREPDLTCLYISHRILVAAPVTYGVVFRTSPRHSISEHSTT